jgi:bacteriocin biosynthesis cyclodehydratase domain-containing protein
MVDFDQISDAARQSIVAQAVPLLPRSAVGLGGAGQKFVLGSTIREEMLGLDGIQTAGGAAPSMTGQTLSTLSTVTPSIGGGAPAVVGYVRAAVPVASGLGAAPSAPKVTAVSSSDLGARIEASIDWIDAHLQSNPLVRVLTVPAYQVTALSTAPRGLAAFWHLYGVHPESGEHALSTQPVHIFGADPIDVGELTDALTNAEVAISYNGGFPVVVVQDYLDPFLAKFNEDMLAAYKPWMLTNLRGRELLIGPVFRPGSNGCYACLAQRLKSNRQMEAYLERASIVGDNREYASAHKATMRAGAAIAAHEILKAIAIGHPYDLSGSILEINSITMETTRHELIKRPQCAVCGGGRLPKRSASHFQLSDCEPSIHAETGSRSVSTEITYDRLKRHVSRLTGVVRSLEPVGEGLRNGLTHSYASGHNFALMQYDLRFALLNLRGRSGGKGIRDIDAKVGAICEAIERYSGVYRGDEEHTRSSFSNLRVPAKLPNELMLFGEAQFDSREQWNLLHTAGFHRVPMRYCEEDVIDWTPAWSLTRQVFVHVPSAYCYFGHPDLQTRFFCSCDSNGNAAGNTMEEAILQGLLELIERDAVAMWWYNRIRRAGISVGSLKDEYVLRLVEFYAKSGRELWILDITSDLGIPVVAAVSRARDRRAEDIIVGFGAHPVAKVAALRAIAEVNQFLPAVAGKDENGQTRYWFPEEEAIRWWRSATIESEAYLSPDSALPAVSIDDMAQFAPSGLNGTLAALVNRVQEYSLEVLVLDQTQPDIDLAVVKVMVPGLRHFWKRFGPGRLYNVPVAMGWIENPLKEEELNPNGVFF